MTTAAATAPVIANEPVHLVLDGAISFPEFPQLLGSSYPVLHDACMPCASMACLNVARHMGYTIPQLVTGMISIRQRDIDFKDGNGKAAPLFTAGSGQTIGDVQADVSHFCPDMRTVLVTGTPEQIRAALHDAITIRHNPCLLNMSLAYELPNNEQSVHNHGVAVLGIDTNLGYDIANGDRVPFGTYGLYFVPWPKIELAAPFALLEYYSLPVAPPPPPPPAIPASLASDLATAIAAVNDMAAASKNLSASGNTLTALLAKMQGELPA